MRTTEFDYHLPKELIAQRPVRPRDHSRLLVLNRKTGRLKHDRFFNLPAYLKKGDLLVFNDSKVIPARLFGRVLHKDGRIGRKIEVLLLQELKKDSWQVLLEGQRRRIGIKLVFSGSRLGATIARHNSDGTWVVKFNKSGIALKKVLFKLGEMPLPPYIKPTPYKLQAKSYQTIYAKREGSVAAPTAGFHFTKGLLDKIKKQGIETAFVTLHVGLGTFLPIREAAIEKHQMHSERFSINDKNAKIINQALQEGRRVISVGTTSARVLETMALKNSFVTPLSPRKKIQLSPVSGETKLFIKPSYKFKIVDGLITNFHLPKSTLLLLVSAFAGKDLIFKAYREAIKKKYRFYSFGDAMLVV